jgi:hypothetical protein
VGIVRYRVTRDFATTLGIGYDATECEFDRVSFTVLQQVGALWQLRYRLSYNQNDLREDSLGVSVSIATATF